MHAQTLSALGEGLYSRAIAQSGTADMALLEDDGEREEKFSAQLAEAINCSSSNHDLQMLTCLQNTPVGKYDDD